MPRRIPLFSLVLTCALLGMTSASAPVQAALPEFVPSKGVPLVGKMTAPLVMALTSGVPTITCKAGTFAGEVTAAKTLSKLKYKMTGCESGGFKCQTTGAASGELITAELTGTIGYVNSAMKKVGLRFRPTTGTDFVDFECVGVLVTVSLKKAVICAITPVNVRTRKFTINCKQSKGVQEIRKFEGESEEVPELAFNGGAPGQAGVEQEASVESASELEIQA
jgi:hypothetical protein